MRTETQCSTGKAEYMRAYREANREYLAAYNREYGKRYRALHKDKASAYAREYYKAHSTHSPMVPGATRASKMCPRCKTLKSRADYTIRQSGPRTGHLAGMCKMCANERQKVAYKRDPSRYRRTEWPSKLKRFYGITVADYERMLSEQGGGCAICKSKVPRTRMYKKIPKADVMFHVDHCHATGRVRGLLCSMCNWTLGMIKDDVKVAQRIVQYLT